MSILSKCKNIKSNNKNGKGRDINLKNCVSRTSAYGEIYRKFDGENSFAVEFGGVSKI